MNRNSNHALCVEQLPELRGMFERILYIARSSDAPAIGNIQLADRLIDAVVSWSENSPSRPEPEGVTDEELVELDDSSREAVHAAVAEALGDVYDCLRVWDAWSYGTMGPDDFSLVAEDDDRVAEIADAAINALARPTIQPVPVAERPWEREGWCNERGWCWMRRKYEPDGVTWRYMLPDPEASGYYRESLPHWALHHD
jgi:hypothetical protein